VTLPYRDSRILAVVFDYDETLVTGDSTTRFLEEHGVDAEKFWREDVAGLVKDGYENTHAWLNLFLDMVGDDAPLGPVTQIMLREFGATLDDKYAPGIPEVFDDLRTIVASDFRDISIEFYVISGGLEEIIRGSKLMQDNMTDIFGCLLGDDPQTGYVARIKRCITFTEKTRHLFEINKGLQAKDTLANPLLVNKAIPEDERRIPFKNMIYIGDGLTDIPCFSLLAKNGGRSFGVFDPTQKTSARRAFLEFLEPKRVVSMHSAQYGENDDLGSLLRVAVAALCTRITVDRESA
jgi:2-hydroxy-3-keto-5-methylthiopentenyl-1-phosphate phosphatase